MARKKVKIHYRKYHRVADQPFSVSLAEAIRLALDAEIDGKSIDSDFSLRKFEENDGTTCLLNGRLRTSAGDVFGELVRYNPESNVSLLVHAKSGTEELEIRELSKPNGADFLRGMAFFLLKNDHVFLIEQDMTTPLMERYMRWLLYTQSKISERDARVQLVPRIFLDPNSDALKTVQAIKLRPPITDTAAAIPSNGKLRVALGHFSDVLGILKAAHFDTGVIERISAYEGAEVELKLDVTFKAGRKKFALKGDEALSMLRNVPEDDLIIEGVGVRKNRGKLERLSDEAYVEQKGNTRDRRDAWAALSEAARSYAEHGLI